MNTLIAIALLPHIAQAALTLRGPDQLVQCEIASFNWSGGVIPYSYNGKALGCAGLGKERGDGLKAGPVTASSLEQNSTIWQGVDWVVDWPAGGSCIRGKPCAGATHVLTTNARRPGTPINFRVATALRMDPYPDQTYAYAGTKIVQPSPSGDASCIPDSHTHETALPNQVRREIESMVITSTFNPTFKVCAPFNVTWTGGVGPFTIMAKACFTLCAVVPVDWEEYAQTFTANDRVFTWTPSVHARSSVYLTIAPADFSTSTVVHSPTVFLDDAPNNECVDPAFRNVSFIARPEKTHPRLAGGPMQHNHINPGITIGNRIVIGLGGALVLIVFYVNRILTNRVQKRMAYERLWYQGQALKEAEAKMLSGFSGGSSPIESLKAQTLPNDSSGTLYHDLPVDSMGGPIRVVR
ncbi:BZ3500_MvSof-1268-A1-R1_Chr1-3g01702 [Microbotryum saponariae]|uniref:BZ3500_MvSof-1268-A1-R1_Chr1-3g01702 protein n=1 Tax=Microbotryum saponariae TaxID=289078 RepID=A0A2X0KRW1_9BASI|nr:BZ3500_MvSof-1268-A1-R1_Chr1-3g01702 [Microbotryum saponariae]SCZ94366.1 BZ3501_MvSof-1269-A2-R1_Chr1-3g01303 [Microbotryum saponariae]